MIVQFSWCSDNQKKELQNAYQAIDKLLMFGNKLTINLMIYLYDEQLGKHLWSQYVSRCEMNVLNWYKQLDVDNRAKLLANIYYNETLYAHC